MNRRRREASISATEYAVFSGDFLAFAETDYRIFELTDAVLIEAQRLLETHPLRAGDAVQLASATLANTQLQSANLPALIFLASDARLLTAVAAKACKPTTRRVISFRISGGAKINDSAFGKIVW